MLVWTLQTGNLKMSSLGCLGGSVGWAADFGSGHDLAVRGFEPHVGLCADSAEPAWDFLFLSLCTSPALSLSLKINIKKKDVEWHPQPLPTRCQLHTWLLMRIIRISLDITRCLLEARSPWLRSSAVEKYCS